MEAHCFDVLALMFCDVQHYETNSASVELDHRKWCGHKINKKIQSANSFVDSSAGMCISPNGSLCLMPYINNIKYKALLVILQCVKSLIQINFVPHLVSNDLLSL